LVGAGVAVGSAGFGVAVGAGGLVAVGIGVGVGAGPQATKSMLRITSSPTTARNGLLLNIFASF
jgi:hypothetical protein